MKIRDQYGYSIPDDLVLLPLGDTLSPEEVETVLNATWYEIEGVLLVSARAVDLIAYDNPIDAGVNITQATLADKVQQVLHRYSQEDGFYHA